MESFFAVILWIATLDYHNEATFQDKPLAKMMLDKKDPMDIVNAKNSWFKSSGEFLRSIVDHFQPPYLGDVRFLTYLDRLREILYLDKKIALSEHLSLRSRGLDENDNNETDPMKEDLFRQCMKEIDDYLNETKGCNEMQWIDSHALAPHASEG